MENFDLIPLQTNRSLKILSYVVFAFIFKFFLQFTTAEPFFSPLLGAGCFFPFFLTSSLFSHLLSLYVCTRYARLFCFVRYFLMQFYFEIKFNYSFHFNSKHFSVRREIYPLEYLFVRLEYAQCTNRCNSYEQTTE